MEKEPVDPAEIVKCLEDFDQMLDELVERYGEDVVDASMSLSVQGLKMEVHEVH